MQRAKPPKSNLIAGERRALRELNDYKDILILPADKGNATVIMRPEDYDNKINEYFILIEQQLLGSEKKS